MLDLNSLLYVSRVYANELSLYSVVVKPCKTRVDIGFIVDSSGSLRSQYYKEKKFVKMVADNFGISLEGTRAGVITFSYQAELSIKFSDFDSAEKLKNAIDSLPMMGSTTRIDKALRMARDQLFLETNGARTGVAKILILLTDGSQTPDADAIDPAVLAMNLLDMGIEFYVVGIGPEVKEAELVSLANGPDNVLQADSFDTLVSPEFVKNISETSCRKGMLKLFLYKSYIIQKHAAILSSICPNCLFTVI